MSAARPLPLSRLKSNEFGEWPPPVVLVGTSPAASAPGDVGLHLRRHAGVVRARGSRPVGRPASERQPTSTPKAAVCTGPPDERAPTQRDGGRVAPPARPVSARLVCADAARHAAASPRAAVVAACSWRDRGPDSLVGRGVAGRGGKAHVRPPPSRHRHARLPTFQPATDVPMPADQSRGAGTRRALVLGLRRRLAHRPRADRRRERASRTASPTLETEDRPLPGMLIDRNPPPSMANACGSNPRSCTIASRGCSDASRLVSRQRSSARASTCRWGHEPKPGA
jgi:hypothetical protein